MKILTLGQTLGLFSLLISFALFTQTFHTANASKNLDFSFSQKLKQHNLCADGSVCGNSGFNVAEMVKGLKQKIYAKVHQELKQHNLCVDSECLNEGYNQLDLGNLKGKFSQKLQQSNECENSKCLNEGVNQINGDGNANSQQAIIQSNECAFGATCINSAGNVYLIGRSTRNG
ncbi:MAG: hypothetical protein ACM3JQ_06440 [Candidatus Eiseniibacteriota bacterium]